MANENRAVSGTIRTLNDQDVAATAYHMALSMWRAEYNKSSPKVSDEDFIRLVNSCALALQGRGTSYDWSVWSK